ncbi:hypothetical protein B0H14DRAFT_2598300 [Mycena olivaceomarginata]|nr:hypothetical protein B0H14DRAFT_2598300 [Mycena olivaceomarginata]
MAGDFAPASHLDPTLFSSFVNLKLFERKPAPQAITYISLRGLLIHLQRKLPEFEDNASDSSVPDEDSRTLLRATIATAPEAHLRLVVSDLADKFPAFSRALARKLLPVVPTRHVILRWNAPSIPDPWDGDRTTAWSGQWMNETWSCCDGDEDAQGNGGFPQMTPEAQRSAPVHLELLYTHLSLVTPSNSFRLLFNIYGRQPTVYCAQGDQRSIEYLQDPRPLPSQLPSESVTEHSADARQQQAKAMSVFPPPY